MTATPQQSLDPEIQQFVQQMGAAWREHPPLDSVSLPEARRIADKVRGRFTAGGPQRELTTEINVPWARGTVRIRAYNARAGDPKPALIYLHGGGWTLFSIDTHDRIMREYAARVDVVVIAVDYSLSPEVRFPRAIEETVGVVHCCRRKVDRSA